MRYQSVAGVLVVCLVVAAGSFYAGMQYALMGKSQPLTQGPAKPTLDVTSVFGKVVSMSAGKLAITSTDGKTVEVAVTPTTVVTQAPVHTTATSVVEGALVSVVITNGSASSIQIIPPPPREPAPSN